MTTAAPDREAAAGARPRLPNWAAFALAVALVWLGGQFVRQGVSDSFLPDHPDQATLWLADSPDALAQLAKERVGQRLTQAGARLAVRALQHEPLNATALSVYGFAMDQLGQKATAEAAMELASQRSWRDVLTQEWLFRRDVLSGRFAEGFQHADALMRRQDVPSPVVMQILTVVAHDPKAIAPLAERLAAAPAWRQRFFEFLNNGTRPPATDIAEALLNRLAATAAPPTDPEVAGLLSALVQQKAFAQAEADWRRLAAGAANDADAVHDGNFDRAPGTTPFDWSLRGGVGWSPQIADAPAGAHGQALKIDYDGASPGQPLRQLVVLAPGAYRLAGRFYDEQGAGAQALSWTLTCIDAQFPLAKAASPGGPPNAWRSFFADFTVPASGCAALWLQLAASPGDVHDPVTVWYDDLKITRAGAAAPQP